MPDTTPIPATDSEQIARRVVKRWERDVKRFLLAAAAIIYIVFTPVMVLMLKGEFPIGIAITTVSLILIMTVMGWCFWRYQRRCAFRLSEQQKDALRSVIQHGAEDEAKTAEGILKVIGETVPAKEYVRTSSAPEQTETLLRAAQPSADTTQEQLLRPTHE